MWETNKIHSCRIDIELNENLTLLYCKESQNQILVWMAFENETLEPLLTPHIPFPVL